MWEQVVLHGNVTISSFYFEVLLNLGDDCMLSGRDLKGGGGGGQPHPDLLEREFLPVIM